jgi:signal transduction histidine kinase
VAQDVVPAPQSLTMTPRFERVVERLRRAHLLPPSATPGRVALTRPVVSYVAAVALVAVVVAALTVSLSIDDWYTLLGGSIATFLLAVYAVRNLPGSTFIWSPSVFINLGLSVTLGPIGAAAAAVGEALGVASRTRNGWFRTIFNVSNDFLSNVAAWAAFVGVERLVGNTNTADFVSKSPVAAIGAGLAAGVAQFVVNHFLTDAVIRISNPAADLPRVVRNSLSVLPYSIGYGMAAFTFVLMRFHAGVVGFLAVLVPIILLQWYLLKFASEANAHEKERTENDLERARLQQKALDASESERTKIAGDLHDGVVQNLAGLAFALSAEASSLKSHPGTVDGREELLGLLERSATETRGAMKDLRTLIIDLAPPTLRREGLEAALLEVLRDIQRSGTNTRLDLPPNLRLRKDRAGLIFRIAHEALRNVASHAHAKNVTVELTTEDGSAILSIVDDGRGYTKSDVDRRRQEGHVGSSNIVDLAEQAGGTLTTDSEPGRGTLVVLTLPIE